MLFGTWSLPKRNMSANIPVQISFDGKNTWMAEQSMFKREQSSNTKQSLLLAAANTFDRKGFLGTNLTDVCASAGVTKGALYCHFPSKEALAVALIESQLRLWHEVHHHLAQQPLSPMQSLIDLSHEFGNRLRTDVRARVGVRLLFEADLFDREAGGQFHGWVAMVRELLLLADAAGQLRPEVHPREAAESLVAAFTGTQLLSRATSGHDDLEARFTALWRLWLPALVVQAELTTLRVGPPSAEPDLFVPVQQTAGIT
ncbi:ScbR family autoregulator-binding transcription factor [Crossiella sp. CA198]|uniref:ScbR family autoregulator-binding transcription factor n=1 Tax=Crossiella sp. CA198 TaxID=3455607 RepID=UPI003F8D2DCD